MRLFDAVREEATAYDVAVNYGLKPNRAKMICCPFHQDKYPSMIFMMQNVLVIAEAFTMYAKRSLRRLPAKHRLTDIGKIPAHAAQPDIYGAV